MKEWGIWHEQPGVYTGWLSFAAGGKRVAMLFEECEATQIAARSEYTQARIVPESERVTAWTEAAWRDAKA